MSQQLDDFKTSYRVLEDARTRIETNKNTFKNAQDSLSAAKMTLKDNDAFIHCPPVEEKTNPVIRAAVEAIRSKL